MKHKAGDMVRIRSKEWIDAQEKNWTGGIRIGESYIFYCSMFEYAGKIARITKVCNNEYYHLDRDDSSWKWTDWMFDPDYTPAGPLSVENAIIAMVRDGETLYDEGGCEYWYDEQKMGFSYRLGEKESGDLCRIPFINFRRRPEKRKRPMTRWEVLAWANSEESRGWYVRLPNVEEWVSPQCPNYDTKLIEYRRARLLSDKSGIDESTIQGFEVEE